MLFNFFNQQLIFINLFYLIHFIIIFTLIIFINFNYELKSKFPLLILFINLIILNLKFRIYNIQVIKFIIRSGIIKKMEKQGKGDEFIKL